MPDIDAFAAAVREAFPDAPDAVSRTADGFRLTLPRQPRRRLRPTDGGFRASELPLVVEVTADAATGRFRAAAGRRADTRIDEVTTTPTSSSRQVHVGTVRTRSFGWSMSRGADGQWRRSGDSLEDTGVLAARIAAAGERVGWLPEADQQAAIEAASEPIDPAALRRAKLLIGGIVGVVVVIFLVSGVVISVVFSQMIGR
ncbi:hypothetical protein [Homoserinibacter sp. YIM 151385]|uniref:hypothetical protein n=1 Tax=Homoserinibacter sp. YIM 151385 TaxID=2985506 RepID=UPI0022F0BA32|nr:hypothetical protein [Homoserinibacter sp. YIM 151385]WBU39218.1 hypothetical protein OF852_06485 [Homoserinibacter sp. YIM 151385]